MEVLHFTNFHMLPLFPMPHSSLFHRSISFQENSGFLVSSKTSITKHFIIKYTRSTHFMAINTVRSSGESLIDFPQRQDRTFSYTQAFNACYVYGEIVRYRRKVAQHLSTEYQTKELTWINEALDSATMMRFNLAERLYHVRDAFLPPRNHSSKNGSLKMRRGNISTRRKHYE